MLVISRMPWGLRVRNGRAHLLQESLITQNIIAFEEHGERARLRGRLVQIGWEDPLAHRLEVVSITSLPEFRHGHRASTKFADCELPCFAFSPQFDSADYHNCAPETLETSIGQVPSFPI